jgi:hypothetical protein
MGRVGMRTTDLTCLPHQVLRYSGRRLEEASVAGRRSRLYNLYRPDSSDDPTKRPCQQNRTTRLAIDYSADWACISHASDVLSPTNALTNWASTISGRIYTTKRRSPRGIGHDR